MQKRYRPFERLSDLMTDTADRVTFAIGTGRCGTHFVAKLFAYEPAVAATHERYPMAEALERYRTWYRLPIDGEGFVEQMRRGIEADLTTHRLSFEASAYLSLSVPTLRERFGARFVLMVRQPDQVVNSLWSKGWYEQPFIQGQSDLALGYQDGKRPHHTFSRIAPLGNDFQRWQQMTRIGRLAWFWAALNRAVLEQFERLPSATWRVVRLEDLDYAGYCDLIRFVGSEPTLGRAAYDALVSAQPGRRPRSHRVSDWATQDRLEFEAEVGPLAEQLDYVYDTAALAAAEPPPQSVATERRSVRTAVGRRVRRVFDCLRRAVK
jgi:hypothetical protein